MVPDIRLRVRFRTPDEGGRKCAIFGELYACPMLIDGEGFDCRLMIKDMELVLGEWHVVPVKFLNRELALSRLVVGKKVILWEGKNVADGTVIQIGQ